MRALVVHPGTQHSRHLAVELHRLNALSGLHTGLAVASGGSLERVINFAPASWQRRVANRRVEELPSRLVSLQPFLESAAMVRIREGHENQTVLHWRNERFQRSVPQRAIEDADVVIGFDTSSWILAERCRKAGKPLVLVQTIGHPDSKKNVLDELAVRFPQWSVAEKPRLPEVREAEQQEHDGATVIIASSSFTRQTLVQNGLAQNNIRVIPHGVDLDRFSAQTLGVGTHPFRFVFVGIIDARKGVPLLLEAWRQLEAQNAELWLVGPASPHIKSLLPDLPGVRYFGAVPQTELPDILRQCDAFVFPSYFEGFGMVILEAMACGLPVITTTSTAGPDLLSTGEAGWVLPPGDIDRLTSTMSYCLSHPSQMPQFGQAAREIAEQSSWRRYGQRWLPALEEATLRMFRSSAEEADANIKRSVEASNPCSRKVLLAHPGTQYSGQLAAQLQQHNVLGDFYTSLAIAGNGFLSSGVETLPNRWQNRLAARRVPGVPAERLHTRPWLEMRALATLRIGMDEEQVFYRRNAAFQRSVPDDAIKSAVATIGFDTSSWILCQRVRNHGRVFLLDQSIGHPRSFARVANNLNQQFPIWNAKNSFKNDEDFGREDQEHRDAFRIVVPSRFVARTLEENGVDGSKIRINPFGVNLDRFQPAVSPPPLKPLRFVFVGALQTRKGIPLLLQAWNRLPRDHGAELWVVGGGEIPAAARPKPSESLRFLGRLPQPEVTKVLQASHVFVFPSYFEGLAQVQIEAAACGLPVIGTQSSGCEEIVRDGETGYVLPTGDLEALYGALLKFVSTPELALAMRKQLLVERSQWSWAAYGERWMEILREAVPCN